MDATTTRFGRRIRQLRLASGMTQEQLAKAAGLDSKHIGVIERGKKSSSFGSVARLAKALRVDIHQLFLPDGQTGAVVPAPTKPSKLPNLRKVPRRELEQFVEDVAVRMQRLQKR